MLIRTEDISLYCRQCTAEKTIAERCIEEAEFSDIMPQIGVKLFRKLDDYLAEFALLLLHIGEQHTVIEDVNVQILQADDKLKHEKITQYEYDTIVAELDAKIDEANDLIEGYQHEIEGLENEEYKMLLEGGYYTTKGGEEMQVVGLKKIEAYYAAARIARSGNEVMTRYGLVNKDDQDSTPSSDKRVANYGAYLKSYADEMMANIKTYLREIEADGDNNTVVGSKMPTLSIYAIGAE